jgi:hypothetical protein
MAVMVYLTVVGTMNGLVSLAGQPFVISPPMHGLGYSSDSHFYLFNYVLIPCVVWSLLWWSLNHSIAFTNLF